MIAFASAHLDAVVIKVVHEVVMKAQVLHVTNPHAIVVVGEFTEDVDVVIDGAVSRYDDARSGNVSIE